MRIYKDVFLISKIALTSRFFYIFICYLSHTILPHFDKSFYLLNSRSFFNCLLKWDAIHFRDISINGYAQEHTSAFFPLLPCITRIFSRFLPIFDIFTVGILLNNFIFALNACLFYKLSTKLFDAETSRKAFFFFVYNPASIVFSSFYTESLFMLIFLLFLFNIIQKKYLHASFLISLSCFCRSNGILFLIFYKLDPRNLVYLIIILFPLGIFQLYSINKILKFRSVDEKVGRFFIPYSKVQKMYWEQGFLRFYSKNNIPNILVGLPFILCSIFIIFYNFRKVELKLKYRKLYNILNALLLVQTILTIFFFHWNMYFRFISHNPIIYWTLAIFYSKMKENMLFKIYTRIYLAFGIAYAFLFGCFYPPA